MQDQDTTVKTLGDDVQLNALLDNVSFVSLLRESIGGAVVIKALHETSLKEWDNAFDANTQEHLVKGVFTSNKKTDFIRIYISKLVAQYMKSVGVRATAWTKNTISSDNVTNVAIANRIAATEYETNEALFTLIVTRLIGFDDKLVEYAIETDNAVKAALLVDYLASKLELVETETDVKLIYPATVSFIEDKLNNNGFTPEFFATLLLAVTGEELKAVPTTDPLDLLVKLGDVQ